MFLGIAAIMMLLAVIALGGAIRWTCLVEFFSQPPFRIITDCIPHIRINTNPNSYTPTKKPTTPATNIDTDKIDHSFTNNNDTDRFDSFSNLWKKMDWMSI